MKPARQKQQKAKLQQVEQDHKRVFSFRQQLVFREHKHGNQVAYNGNTNRQITKPVFLLEAEIPLGNHERDNLTGHSKPANPDYGSKTNPITTAFTR